MLHLAPLLCLTLLASPPQAPAWEQAGLRRIEGRHLVLYTDLPNRPAVDELPRIFDLAVGLWAEKLGAQPELWRDWRITGFLIADRDRLRPLGLPPADLPPFQNGYQRGTELWVYDQPSDYYRRHLLLHEGVHAFMTRVFHGGGPPWYMEGVAEWLATHSWDGRQLQVGVLPPDRDAVPQWGRIKIVRDGYAAGQARTLPYVWNYSDQAHLQVEPYGWCWAASYFLANLPQSQQEFLSLALSTQKTKTAFNEQLQENLAPRWNEVALQWQLFVTDLDYGYDLQRELVRHAAAEDLPPGGAAVRVDAAHGWQSTGVRLRTGRRYQLAAKGRYQLGDDPRPWWCEPNGVTIRYHQGKPLGVLLAAVHDPDQPLRGLSELARPLVVGLEREIQPSAGGVLYLKINESPSQWRDNRGDLEVLIRPAPE